MKSELLRQLSKTASLVLYEGEGHGKRDWRRVNVIDYWERVLAWFDQWLRP